MKQYIPTFDEFVDVINENEYHLLEKLIPAEKQFLFDAMCNDEQLTKLITTPAKDLPDQYRYLVGELTVTYANNNLLQFMCDAMRLHFKRTVTKSFFAISNENKIVGFVAYSVSNNNPKEIVEMKMFSTVPGRGNGFVLIKDMVSFFDELIKEYDIISWSAHKDNPANKIYQVAIEKYNGEICEVGNDIEYTIKNKNIL